MPPNTEKIYDKYKETIESYYGYIEPQIEQFLPNVVIENFQDLTIDRCQRNSLYINTYSKLLIKNMLEEQHGIYNFDTESFLEVDQFGECSLPIILYSLQRYIEIKENKSGKEI